MKKLTEHKKGIHISRESVFIVGYLGALALVIATISTIINKQETVAIHNQTELIGLPNQANATSLWCY